MAFSGDIWAALRSYLAEKLGYLQSERFSLKRCFWHETAVRIRQQHKTLVVVVGGSLLHYALRASLGLRNVNEAVEGVAYGRSLRECNLEGVVVVVH